MSTRQPELRPTERAGWFCSIFNATCCSKPDDKDDRGKAMFLEHRRSNAPQGFTTRLAKRSDDTTLSDDTEAEKMHAAPSGTEQSRSSWPQNASGGDGRDRRSSWPQHRVGTPGPEAGQLSHVKTAPTGDNSVTVRNSKSPTRRGSVPTTEHARRTSNSPARAAHDGHHAGPHRHHRASDSPTRPHPSAPVPHHRVGETVLTKGTRHGTVAEGFDRKVEYSKKLRPGMGDHRVMLSKLACTGNVRIRRQDRTCSNVHEQHGPTPHCVSLLPSLMPAKKVFVCADVCRRNKSDRIRRLLL